jgi:toxin ParE1/3/4
MARSVLWRRCAEEDLAEAYLYLGMNSPASSERFVEAVQEVIDLLIDHPQIGNPWISRSTRLRGVRRWPIPGFANHLLFFRMTGSHLEVLRLLHGARDLQGILEDEG